jgi:hypothetical protein
MKKKVFVTKTPQSSVKMGDMIFTVGFNEIIFYEESVQQDSRYHYSSAYVLDKETFNAIVGWYLNTVVKSEPVP